MGYGISGRAENDLLLAKCSFCDIVGGHNSGATKHPLCDCSVTPIVSEAVGFLHDPKGPEYSKLQKSYSHHPPPSAVWIFTFRGKKDSDNDWWKTTGMKHVLDTFENLTCELGEDLIVGLYRELKQMAQGLHALRAARLVKTGDPAPARTAYDLARQSIRLPDDDNEPYKGRNAFDGPDVVNWLLLREVGHFFDEP